MATTIRFPDGRAVTYNQGWHVEYGDRWVITDRENHLVAVVQPTPGLIVEWVAPCSVKQADGTASTDDIRDVVRDEIRRHEDRERKRLQNRPRRRT